MEPGRLFSKRTGSAAKLSVSLPDESSQQAGLTCRAGGLKSVEISVVVRKF
jgi:hypothetical protein